MRRNLILSLSPSLLCAQCQPTRPRPRPRPLWAEVQPKSVVKNAPKQTEPKPIRDPNRVESSRNRTQLNSKRRNRKPVWIATRNEERGTSELADSLTLFGHRTYSNSTYPTPHPNPSHPTWPCLVFVVNHRHLLPATSKIYKMMCHGRPEAVSWFCTPLPR